MTRASAPQSVFTQPARAGSTGPGSEAGYSAQHNLDNIPSNPPAPILATPPPQYAPKQGSFSQTGDSGTNYERALGLFNPADQPAQAAPFVPNNTPQGRSIQEVMAALKPSAAAQLELDRQKRLTVGR
jgi:hypothetical protein